MIRCYKDYKEVVSTINKSGNEVNGTYELIGQKIEFMQMETDAVKLMFRISDIFEQEFIQAICKFEKKVIGPYITEKYFSIIPKLKMAAKQIVDDCNETRRAVITFPKEHCFQSIQFLLRENTVNVVCFMRSCDAIKNLPYDAWLCYKLADMFSRYVNEISDNSIITYSSNKVTMMFGSLHVYERDVKNVL